jgi:predicted alpha/beta-fold hydrolase
MLKVYRHMSTKTFTKLAADAFVNGWHSDFTPRRFLNNGHLMTLVGNFLPRQWSLPDPEDLLVEVEGPVECHASYGLTRVLCHCHWQAADVRSQRLTVVLVHGLEGSSNSQYVLGNSTRAWAAGCNVVRMNMRSCGGTDKLSPAIYDFGISAFSQCPMLGSAHRLLHGRQPGAEIRRGTWCSRSI